MTSMATNSTAKLWLQYMAMVDILKKFIRAKRTGNFNLHLEATNDMLPYFAAAGHNFYLKSAQLYLQKMSKLKTEHPDVHHHFKKGYMWLEEVTENGQDCQLTSSLSRCYAQPKDLRRSIKRARINRATASNMDPVNANLCRG